MCVTIIFHKFLKEYPLIIGNNRDEMVYRKFSPPQLLNTNPKIFGPKDLERGGTWLGINEYKIFVNILNKWTEYKNFFGSEKYISRGQLVLNLLKEKRIKDILKKLKSLDLEKFLPFHLLIADRDKVFVVIKNKDITFYEITDKIFILGNLDPFQKWEKYEYGYKFIQENDFSSIESIEKNLKKLLQYRKGDKTIPSTDYAVDLGDFKTTSSTFIALNKQIIFHFLDGFPSKRKYKQYSCIF